MSQANPQLQKSQSFYSIYSNQSVVQQIPTTFQKQPQMIYRYEANTPSGPEASPSQFQKRPKIAQSNINLDDAFDGNQSSERDYETLGRKPSKQVRRQEKNKQQILQRKQEEDNILSQIALNDQNISEIQYKDERQQMSVCLLKQIDCLSVEQVSPEELRQIKNKIQILKKQQFALESSLLLANNMLTNSQSRNKILEQQIQSYKESLQKRQQSGINVNYKIEHIKTVQTNPEKRRIVQDLAGQGLQGNGKTEVVDRLKNMYKQCCFCQRYCVYQNQGYKIEVAYERDGAGVIVCVKLTPHHHIANKKAYKFGLQLQSKKPIDFSTLSYEGSILTQPYSEYPASTYSLPLTIHQLEQSGQKHHTHSILIPLPLSHFFEARLLFVKQEQINKIIRNLSEYILEFTGASSSFVEKLKQIWWSNRFVSTVGAKQMAYIQICNEQDSLDTKLVKLKVYGKTGGPLVTNIIEFLTFLLSP